MCGAQHSARDVVSIQQTSAATNILIKWLRCVCACVHLGPAHDPLVFVFPCRCMSAHTRACGSVPFTLYACACMSTSVCPYGCVDLCDRDRGFFCLGMSLHLSQDVGVVAIAPWQGSASKCRRWVAVGEGLQRPAPGNGFLARKAVVSLVLFHPLPLFLLHQLPQSRLSLVPYPPPPPRAKSASSSPS